MPLRDSADAVIANLAQLGSGVLLLLAIPNLLPGELFAVTVVASVVLSFTRFPELGLSLVYGRDVPRHHASGAAQAVKAWDTTLVWFGVLSGSLVGAAAGAAFFALGADAAHALLLALIPPLAALSAAFVAFPSARGDFRRYRSANVMLAAGRLLAIPFVYFFGLTGWFVAQVLGTAMSFAGSGLAWLPRPAGVDWPLVKRHLPAALLLAAITLAWLQVLDCARLLAALRGSPEEIAEYGIVVSVWQAAYGVVIAAFLPVTVNTLRLLGANQDAAARYVQDVIARTLPWAIALAIAAAEAAPWLLGVTFPRYALDPVMVRSMLYPMSLLPILATVGNLLIGRGRNALYLALLGVALGVAFAVDGALHGGWGMRSAAYGQLAGILALATMLLAAAQALFPSAAARWWRPALWLLLAWGAYLPLRHAWEGP